MKLKILSLYLITLFLNFNLYSFQKNTFDSIYKTVSFYSKRKENKKALNYARKLLQKGVENNEVSQQAKSYYKIAEFQRKLNVKDSAFYFYNRL